MCLLDFRPLISLFNDDFFVFPFVAIREFLTKIVVVGKLPEIRDRKDSAA